MLLGAILVPYSVRAAGTISVNGGATITVPSGQTTVSVPIQVANSAGFNGFQIIVLTDPTVLSAASIDLTGSVLPSPSILAECVNGVLIAGTSCANQAGVAGTVELAAANNAGGSTTNPVSGTIFTFGFNASPSCNCNRWNPYADVANRGVIDIIDVTIASANFNTFA